MRLPTKERVHASIGMTEVKTGLLLDNSYASRDNADWLEPGMAMALAMLYSKDALFLVAGYESGHAVVYKLSGGSWSSIYLQSLHSQPGKGHASSIVSGC